MSEEVLQIASSDNRFSELLVRVLSAAGATRAVRACLLSTRDRDHAMNVLKDTALAGHPAWHFTVAGRRRFQPEHLRWSQVSREAADAFGLLQHARELKGGGIVILEDIVPALRDEGGDPRARMLLADMLASPQDSDGTVLVFLEPPTSAARLPAMLADQFVRIEVAYPRAQELETIARTEIALMAHRSHAAISPDDIKRAAPQLASGLVGLTRSAARDALRDALAGTPSHFADAYERLQARKSQQLSRDLAMNVLDADAEEMPIGLDCLMDYLHVTAGRLRVTGSGRARGVLLIGPPGTGKTMLARAIGQVVQLPVVEFRISALMNSLLGATEQRFAQAFATLEAMAPNVVFIDEIEKAFGDQSERDGGTMMRCTGALLSWLSDNPHPNFIVATSNSLRRMGEIGLTMTRSERFDASFFVDVPGSAARQQMLERWLAPHLPDAAPVSAMLAGQCERFSGADLRSVVKLAVARAEHLGNALSQDLLLEQVRRKQQRATGLYDEFQELRRWGRLYCDPAGPGD